MGFECASIIPLIIGWSFFLLFFMVLSGIPGKKCGSIIFTAEELSNCRVSAHRHSDIMPRSSFKYWHLNIYIYPSYVQPYTQILVPEKKCFCVSLLL